MSRPVALLLALAAACGPVMATGVVDDASVALARAKATEGDKYAAYETTLAELYFAKAREEQGHARYAEAQKLAAEAIRYADAATRKAAERRAAPSAPPAPTATVQHPDPAAPAPSPPPEKKP